MDKLQQIQENGDNDTSQPSAQPSQSQSHSQESVDSCIDWFTNQLDDFAPRETQGESNIMTVVRCKTKNISAVSLHGDIFIRLVE